MIDFGYQINEADDGNFNAYIYVAPFKFILIIDLELGFQVIGWVVLLRRLI